MAVLRTTNGVNGRSAPFAEGTAYEVRHRGWDRNRTSNHMEEERSCAARRHRSRTGTGPVGRHDARKRTRDLKRDKSTYQKSSERSTACKATQALVFAHVRRPKGLT